jgi:hypothetical protein
VNRTLRRRSQFSAAAVTVRRDETVDTGAARQRAGKLAKLVNELSGNGAAATLRLEVLRYLDQFGPSLIREIPRAWPITRQHIRSQAGRLMEDGLLSFAENGDPGAPRRLNLTEEGRRVLEEIDWNETIRLADEEITV